MRSSVPVSVIVAVLASAGCSKKNTIDMSSDVATGVACTGAGDPTCGKDGVCVLDYCRVPCSSEADCLEDALCIGPGPEYGCQLTWDAFCNSSLKCKEGLECGIDSKCRMPCTTSDTCPRADHECVRGTCVAKTEPGADAWFGCTTGESRCVDETRREVCNEVDPGWVEVACGGTTPHCVGGQCVAER